MIRFTCLALALFTTAMLSSLGATNSPAAASLEKAQATFKVQNWADARTEFDHARDLVGDWHSPQARLAVEGAVACSMRLNQWDDALTRAQAFVDQNKGRFEEAVGERFLAGLYLSVPHRGTKSGGTYHRGEYGQGVQVSSFKKDRKEAVKRYEHAREILAGLVKAVGTTPDNPDSDDRKKLLNGEQIGLDFDLTAALATHENYYGGWGWCFWWWGGGEAEEESDAAEEADYEQPREFQRYSGEQQKPTGLPLDPDGKPHFMATPTTYAAGLGDGLKIRFLLEEVQHLDGSETRDDSAKALFRLAMICRGLYGPEIMQQWNNQGTRYDRFGHPLPKQPDADAPSKKIWELADDEAIAIAGGKLQVVTLPDAESPLALLQRIEKDCPKSMLVPEAIYTRGLYLQSRQQFPQALTAYQRLIETFPKADRVGSAQAQMKIIREPGILLEQTGVHLPDEKPVIGFTSRNADAVKFTARRFDLLGYINQSIDHLDNDNYWRLNNLSYDLFQREDWRKFTGDTVATWTETGLHNEANRVEEGKTSAPLTEPGAYIVEARVAGNPDGSRLLVFITDIAIVNKHLPKKGLIYIADARSGQALANHPVRIVETWMQYDAPKGVNRFHTISTALTTNDEGSIEYQRKQTRYGSNINAIVTDGKQRMGFSFFQNWNENDYYPNQENGPRYYVITDRPVYRPGTTVKFHAWIRNKQDGLYQKAIAGQTVTLEVWDPKGARLNTATPTTDESGSVSGEYTLEQKAPLGIYTIRVNGTAPDAGYPYGNHYAAGGLFRVEEYKKPEFEVTVKPAKTQARLGEKVSAHIEAKYYFGAPVAQGHLSYKIYREDYHHVYWGPGEYDWLYGAGYGRDYYPYPWFPWWGRWGCFILGDLWPWPYGGGYMNGYGGDQEAMDRRSAESGTRHALRELVSQGEGELKPDGGYDVEFDTAPALRDLGDRDHRYTIEAEVRDASRRTITGQGDIKVTRQQFYAFAETREGWYQPQEDVFVDVRTLSADNEPVATQGKVTVYKVTYDGDHQSVEKEESVKSWDASTDVEGRLSFKYPVPSEGQYRICYVTHDDWKQEVQANAVFWVAGPKFDGRVYRFNDLEIVADKRTYAPGDTARLLVNTAENNSRILFSDSVSGDLLLNYRFINLPQRSTIIDVPITDAQMPNFFVEATLVRNGRVHMETRELFVPPSKNILNLAVETDKATYKPGEKGQVRVKLTDMNGKPVSGHVTLTAFDQSVTYIQDEFGPAPKVFYYGQRRTDNPFVDASLDRIYQPYGSIQAPENNYYGGGLPEGWQGFWGISNGGLTLSGSIAFATHGVDNYRSDESRARNGMAIGGLVEADADKDLMLSAQGAAAPMSKAMAGLKREVAEDSVSVNSSTPAATAPPGGGGFLESIFSGPKLVDPTIRSNFADTALWLPDLKTDEDGKAETTITFPDSLTTWRVHGYGLTTTTQVGDGITHTTTSKNLIVRLEAPRFFIERDEATLSANVHNYLAGSKSVTAELILPSAQFQSLDQPDLKPDADGNLHLTAKASVEAKGEHRFDWPVKILNEGTARVTVKALTDEESDAMQLSFPVLVHGINKMVAQGGSYRVGDSGSRELKLDLPAQINPEQTKLEVTLSPSLAGVMIDALPYLAGYPYGCVEQTMSRFYPSVLVRDTLKNMGTDLEAVGKQRKQMYTTADIQHRFGNPYHDPVFDSDELDKMVRAGLRRLTNFQHPDGGWGWWAEDDSSPFETAYVLQGLQAAKEAHVDIDNGSYENGLNFLQNWVRGELAKPKDKQYLGGYETQSYVAYILALANRAPNDDEKKWLDDLYEKRGDQNNYGKALLAITFKLRHQDDRAALLLQNILQFAARDDSNETAWIRTPQEGWWFWYNNDIETNAWVLKALAAIDPKNDLAPRIVKWLLNNRKNGTYWRSTRDTAQVIAAMAEYMKVSGEGDPNYTLNVKLDGDIVKTVKVTKENFFTFDNRFLLYGLQVKPGPHTITLEKDGAGALYYSAYLSYFTKEDDIKGAGNEILITREYYRLKPKTETVKANTGGSGWNWWGSSTPNPAGQENPDDASAHTEMRSGWDRIPLHNGDSVTSGDQVEVVLQIQSKNTYDFLAFEDMKPAGCEPVELRSGGKFAGGLCPNVELRDEKVVFFIGLLEQGQHILRYKLRAETPGVFHALPTSGYAMYAPEVRAISDEMKLKIVDQK